MRLKCSNLRVHFDTGDTVLARVDTTQSIMFGLFRKKKTRFVYRGAAINDTPTPDDRFFRDLETGTVIRGVAPLYYNYRVQLLRPVLQ